MSGGPKRQHHIAQAILKNFLTDGENKLWYYNRPRNIYELRTPRAIAHARNQYTFEDIESNEKYALETAFSNLEDRTSPVFRELDRQNEIADVDRITISEFIGLQFVRTPTKVSMMGELETRGSRYALQQISERLLHLPDDQFQNEMAKYATEMGSSTNLITKEAIRDWISKSPVRVPGKNSRLTTMVEQGTELGIEFSSRSWIILHAPSGSSFIASDAASFIAPDGETDSSIGFGPGAPGMAVFFPFSRNSVLMVTSRRFPTLEHQNASKDAVKRINSGIAQVGNEIYSNSKELIASIVNRNHLAGTKFEPRFDEEQIRQLIEKHFKENGDV